MAVRYLAALFLPRATVLYSRFQQRPVKGTSELKGSSLDNSQGIPSSSEMLLMSWIEYEYLALSGGAFG